MHQTLQVFDGFYRQPDVFRERALALSFRSVEHAGIKFHGVAQMSGLDAGILWWLVEDLCKPMRVSNRKDFFRLGTRDTPPTTYIHADMDMGEFAGVLYLNTPEQRFGGTAFWRHKATGWDRLPERPLTEQEAAMLHEDGMDDSKWEIETKVGMQFNRFITYPTRMFHSRYPNHIDAEKKEDGRLVWACFYDLA